MENLEILMSTMNKKRCEDLKINEKNIDEKDSLLIINQVKSRVSTEKIKNGKMVSFIENGLSQSRNRAIELSSGEVCLIADDDVVYKKGYREIILQEHRTNPAADIIVFQIQTFEGEKFKKYSKKRFYHNIFTVSKISSIEITFKVKKIKELNIKFDENFGLGNKFSIGEESIFLKECLLKGLKILYVPIPIVYHSKESSGKNINGNYLFNKGATFQKLYPKSAYFLATLFILKKFIVLKEKKKIINIYKGVSFYKKMEKIK